MAKRILVVEDEKPILNIIKFNLLKEGFEVYEAQDGEEGVEKAFKFNPDLVLLDIMLPKKDGFTVCRELRQKLSIPIIMLTARGDEVDKVLGLELGADDYVTKPFSTRELIARVKAHLRRHVPEALNSKSTNISIGDLSIDVDRYIVQKNSEELELTLREFELLKFLAMQSAQIFSREALLEQVWGYEYYGDVRTVDVTVRRLREKIEDDSSMPKYILTKRGVGYYFNDKIKN